VDTREFLTKLFDGSVNGRPLWEQQLLFREKRVLFRLAQLFPGEDCAPVIGLCVGGETEEEAQKGAPKETHLFLWLSREDMLAGEANESWILHLQGASEAPVEEIFTRFFYASCSPAGPEAFRAIAAFAEAAGNLCAACAQRAT